MIVYKTIIFSLSLIPLIASELEDMIEEKDLGDDKDPNILEHPKKDGPRLDTLNHGKSSREVSIIKTVLELVIRQVASEIAKKLRDSKERIRKGKPDSKSRFDDDDSSRDSSDAVRRIQQRYALPRRASTTEEKARDRRPRPKASKNLQSGTMTGRSDDHVDLSDYIVKTGSLWEYLDLDHKVDGQRWEDLDTQRRLGHF